MVSRCANPECGNGFRYLNRGKLYILPAAAGEVGGEQNLVKRLLWLCEQCCERIVVLQGPGGVARLAPRERSRAAAA
jgi:hypothetical protein